MIFLMDLGPGWLAATLDVPNEATVPAKGKEKGVGMAAWHT